MNLVIRVGHFEVLLRPSKLIKPIGATKHQHAYANRLHILHPAAEITHSVLERLYITYKGGQHTVATYPDWFSTSMALEVNFQETLYDYCRERLYPHSL